MESLRLRPAVYSYSPNIGYIGTYVPRECGIATFTADLVNSVHDNPIVCEPFVAAVVKSDEDLSLYKTPVRLFVRETNYGDYFQTANFFNEAPVSVVNLQHEFGIFGGEWGEFITATLDNLRKPVVTTLHTVMENPNPICRELTKFLVCKSEKTIVMNPLAIDILRRYYGVKTEDVIFIHHGAPDTPLGNRDVVKRELGLHGRTIISTFGLISRGKGLEYAIQALQIVVKHHPNILYLIIGETHPNMKRLEGESYRQELQDLISQLRLDGQVRFINRYLPKSELVRYLQATDIYLTPYINPNQIVSGTLAYAMAAGKPIISTPYLYAQEICADGRGIFVNFKDFQSILKALLLLLDNPDLRLEMEQKAYSYGRQMTWHVVGKRYAELFATIAQEKQAILR